MEPSESKSAVGICPPIFFFFHVILIQSHLPACLITLINYHFGRGPVCFQLPSAPAEFRSSSWHQLFLNRAWCSKQFWMGSPPKALFLRRPCWKAPNGKPAELEETNQSCACSVLPEFGWFGLSPDLWFPNLRLCASRFPRIAFWCPGIIPKKFPIVSVLRKPWGTASPMGAGKADLLLTRVGNRSTGSLPPLTDSCLVWLAEL